MVFTYLGALLPLYSLSGVFYVEWSLFKILPLLLIPGALLSQGHRLRLPEVGSAAVLLLYAFTITLLHYFGNLNGPFDYAITHGQNPSRTYTHMIVQLGMLFGAVLNVFLLRHFVRTQRDVERFVNGFINGNILSVVFGVVQFSMGVATYQMHGRVNGLGNEPRHFGSFLVLALIVIIANTLASRVIRIPNVKAKAAV